VAATCGTTRERSPSETGKDVAAILAKVEVRLVRNFDLREIGLI
jgi:hypothetical protein